MSYAKNTEVSIDKSLSEIRNLLIKNNAQAVIMAETKVAASLSFMLDNYTYKLFINYPLEEKVKYTEKGKVRTAVQIEKELESEKKRLWRAMVLYLKASIEASNNGLMPLRQTMMSSIISNNGSGKTLYQLLESNMDNTLRSPVILLK